MADVVMAYIVMANTAMAYTVVAAISMAYTGMPYTFVAYTGADIIMADTSTAVRPLPARHLPDIWDRTEKGMIVGDK